MRRSQAPSMRRAAKRGLPACEPEVPKKVCAPNEMQWGTTGGYRSLGPRRYGETENPLKDKRIFLVLWRPQSNKKHKTWKGNGTLEVTESRATLRDETSKVLDVLTCFKPEKFQENALIEIGMKPWKTAMTGRILAWVWWHGSLSSNDWHLFEAPASPATLWDQWGVWALCTLTCSPHSADC